MEKFHEAVAATLRGWAAKKNIKQEQIGELLGIKQQNVSNRMSGQTPFTVDEIHAIITALDIDPHEFINDAKLTWLQSQMALAAYVDPDPTEDELLRQEHPDDEVS